MVIRKLEVQIVGDQTRTRRSPTIHPLALIGSPPEHRDWKPGSLMFSPSVHPTANVGAFVTVDAGMRTNTRVGARTMLMKHVHIGHDAQVGADCELAPHVTICGHAVIGDRVRIGANASVRPFVRIGDGARIGMGAVVVKNVPAGEVWVGNPARRLRGPYSGAHLKDSEQRGWEAYAAQFAPDKGVPSEAARRPSRGLTRGCLLNRDVT